MIILRESCACVGMKQELSWGVLRFIRHARCVASLAHKMKIHYQVEFEGVKRLCFTLLQYCDLFGTCGWLCDCMLCQGAPYTSQNLANVNIAIVAKLCTPPYLGHL